IHGVLLNCRCATLARPLSSRIRNNLLVYTAVVLSLSREPACRVRKERGGPLQERPPFSNLARAKPLLPRRPNAVRLVVFPDHVVADVVGLAERRVPARLAPCTPLPALRSVARAVIRTRAVARIRGDRLLDHRLSHFRVGHGLRR